MSKGPGWWWLFFWRIGLVSWIWPPTSVVRKTTPFSFFFLFLSLIFHFSSPLDQAAVLYINFVNATANHGCQFYGDLIEDIKKLSPSVTVFTSTAPGIGIAFIQAEPYGRYQQYDTSGLALTLLNLTDWPVVEALLARNPDLTVSLTPCEPPLSSVFFLFLPH